MNIASDEVLKKKYDRLYQKFSKGNFLEVIRECNRILKKRRKKQWVEKKEKKHQQDSIICMMVD